MPVHQIEKELCDALEMKKPPKESRQRFLGRLVDAAGKLKDDEWEGLSSATQDWVNAAIKASNDDKDIPEFDGGDEAEEEKQPAKSAKGKDKAPAKKAAKQEEDEEERKPAKKGAAAKAPPPKKSAASNGAASSPDGVKHRIKMAIIKKPDISKDELIAQLSKGGTKVSHTTVATIRAEFRHSLRVLHSAGKIDIEV